MTASGSGGEHARPWTATSTWAPAGGGAVEEAISFETSDEDAEASPTGVVLSRRLRDGDGDAPPCEVTVFFRGKYEIHRVYVRSTARIYEIYHSTDTKCASKDYLCTVRCGLAVKEPQPSGEESMAQWSSNTSTREKSEQETKSVSSNSDEDSWVDVKIPESPVGNNTTDSQERNTVGAYQENTLAHYEATAEMTDVSPCVSLTVRLLSLQSKTSVHIEEIYIFADPVESTDDNSVTGPGNMGGSSLLSMLVPGLMQMSKSRNWKIDDEYFSHGSRTQLTQDCAIKESSPCEKTAQEAGPCSTDDSKYKPARMESGINPAYGGIVSKERCNQGDFQLKDPKFFPLPEQTTENTQVPSVMDRRVSNTDQLAHPLMNETFTPYNHIERKLDTLLSKVEKMELYCSRFEDSMIKPLGSIEARLQRLEQQFDSFSVEIQSLRVFSARMPAPDGQSDTTNSQEKAYSVGNARTTASITDRQPGLVVRAPEFSSEDSCGYNVTGPGLAVRAPVFSSEDSFGYNVTDENQVNIHGSNMVPRLFVKVPDFISQPELTGERLHNGPSSPVACALSSGKERKTSPGLVVKVPEFPDDDDDDDEMEEEKGAEVGDHDDGHAQYDDTLSKSTVDSSKSKIPVSINGALASALEALLSSTRGTAKSVVCTASNLSAENATDSSSCSLSPENVDEISTEVGSADKFPGTFGNANFVGTFMSSQEADAAPHNSLSNTMLDGKVEVNEQNNDLNSDKVEFVASTESLGVPSQPYAVEESIDDGSRVNGQNSGPNLDTMPFVASTRPFDPPQPHTVFESVDSEAQVNEIRPAVSLAEFLAARSASSCTNGTSEVCGGNDGVEILCFEITSAGAGKKLENISQLLVKKALEVDANVRKPFSSVPVVNFFEGSGYAATGNAAKGHDINTIETLSDKDYGLENTENNVRPSVGMDSTIFQCRATDSKKKWIYNSTLDWSLDDNFSGPNAEHSWSNLSGMVPFSGAPAKEPVVLATTTSGKYVEDDLTGIGIGSTVSPVAVKELQKVCDLLYEYKADMLDVASTEKRTSKSSPSLEVLLGESSDSETQISDLEDNHNDAGTGSAQLFSTFSSSDDASAAHEPLVDVSDLTAPSEPYASALNEPLVDVFDLPNPSEKSASGVNELLASEDCMPKPLETVAGGSSGEHPDSLI